MASMGKGPQFKSNLYAIVKDVGTANITERVKNELIKTPFWILIECILEGRVDKNTCRKSDLAVYQILQTYVKNEEVFRINDKDFKIYAEDMKLIFGIRDGNMQIDVKKNKAARMRNKTAFEKRCFPKVARLTRKEIDKVFKRLCSIESENLTDENVQDICRVLVLKLLVSLFLSNNGCNLPFAYLEYVEDMERIAEYNWTEHIFDFFKKSLEEKEATEVIGCVMMIPYWYCEHSKIIEPIEEGRIPRCAKWNLMGLEAELRKTPFIDVSFPVVYLKPTEIEVELLGAQRVVELLEYDEDDEEEAVDEAAEQEEKEEEEEEAVDEAGEQEEKEEEKGEVDEAAEQEEKEEEKGEVDEAAFSAEKEIRELRCENQRLKDQLLKAEEEKDLQNVEIEKLQMEITEALNKENELICENQKFKDQLQKAEFEKLQMEITEALNKENELICENQKFKDQLKNADKEVKRLKKENDFQNRKLAELQREYVGINQAHEEESAKMEARIEDLQSQLTIITLQQLKKGKEAEEEQSMEVLETRKIKKRKEIVKVEEKGRKRKKETKKVEDLKNELPELNKERQPVKHLNKDLLNVITELKTGDCLCVEEKSMKFIFFDDILDVLHEKSISNNVIDAFCFLLLEERKIKGVSSPRKPIIHDSLIWTHIVREGHRGEANPQLQQELKDGLEASILIFPMNSAGGNIEASPFHWTLLVFDVEARTWTFYNSWLKSKSEANFVKDAELVKDYVHKRRQELLEKEGKTRDKDPFQLIVKEDSPQQKSCSEDCGIIVLYIIEMILNDKVIPEDIPFETVQAYRARIATCLLDSKK